MAAGLDHHHSSSSTTLQSSDQVKGSKRVERWQPHAAMPINLPPSTNYRNAFWSKKTEQTYFTTWTRLGRTTARKDSRGYTTTRFPTRHSSIKVQLLTWRSGQPSRSSSSSISNPTCWPEILSSSGKASKESFTRSCYNSQVESIWIDRRGLWGRLKLTTTLASEYPSNRMSWKHRQ